MELGILGRILIYRLIAEKGPIARAGIEKLLAEHPELHFTLGKSIGLNEFLDWSVKKRGIIEEAGRLRISPLGANVVASMRSSKVENALNVFGVRKASDRAAAHA